jgi:hypothetical protein
MNPLLKAKSTDAARREGFEDGWKMGQEGMRRRCSTDLRHNERIGASLAFVNGACRRLDNMPILPPPAAETSATVPVIDLRQEALAFLVTLDGVYSPGTGERLASFLRDLVRRAHTEELRDYRNTITWGVPSVVDALRLDVRVRDERIRELEEQLAKRALRERETT